MSSVGGFGSINQTVAAAQAASAADDAAGAAAIKANSEIRQDKMKADSNNFASTTAGQIAGGSAR